MTITIIILIVFMVVWTFIMGCAELERREERWREEQDKRWREAHPPDLKGGDKE